MRAEVLLPVGCALGEGASAVNASEFWFVDIRAGQVHRGSVDGSTAVHAQFDHTVSAVVPTMTGEVVVAEWIIGGRVTVLSPMPGGRGSD